MELAYFADEITKEDFGEAVRQGVEAGATGIELRNGIWGKRIAEIDDEDVKRVQDVLAKYGVKILSIGSPFGKCAHDDEGEKAQHQKIFDRMIALSEAFDTRVIRSFSLWNPLRKKGEDRSNRPDIDDYMDVIVPFFEPAVKKALDADVVISIENEGATLAGTCAEARKVADALGNPASFTYCWDVNNGIGCGENALPDGYEQIKGNITHLHVKPNPDKELDPIRNGDLKYEDLLKTLLADGYTGAASIEHWGSPELMLKGVRLLRGVLDSL
ncbi:MAG: sugar phosphate isomerase/epimerase [bacterium]|nr:sugar phosphate isomerase/epimerase [bacterium]